MIKLWILSCSLISIHWINHSVDGGIIKSHSIDMNPLSDIKTTASEMRADQFYNLRYGMVSGSVQRDSLSEITLPSMVQNDHQKNDHQKNDNQDKKMFLLEIIDFFLQWLNKDESSEEKNHKNEMELSVLKPKDFHSSGNVENPVFEESDEEEFDFPVQNNSM